MGLIHQRNLFPDVPFRRVFNIVSTKNKLKRTALVITWSYIHLNISRLGGRSWLLRWFEGENSSWFDIHPILLVHAHQMGIPLNFSVIRLRFVHSIVAIWNLINAVDESVRKDIALLMIMPLKLTYKIHACILQKYDCWHTWTVHTGEDKSLPPLCWREDYLSTIFQLLYSFASNLQDFAQ